MFSGIRKRLLLSFLILVLLTVSAIGTYVLWYSHQSNLSSLTASLRMQALLANQVLSGPLTPDGSRPDVDSFVKNLTQQTGLRLTVIQPNGKVIADSWENPAIMDNHLQRPEVAAALSGQEGIAIRYSSTLDQNMLYVALPMYSNGKLVGITRVSDSLEHIEAGFAKIRSALILAFVIAALLAIAVSYWLARSYTKPLDAITAAARQLAAGRLEHRVHVRTGDEVEILAHTFNQLSSNLEDKIAQKDAETRKLGLILQHMDNAVLLLDRFGNVLSSNKPAQETFDIKENLIGKHNLTVIGSSSLDRAIKDIIKTQIARSIDLKLTLRNNQRRVFQVFLAPLPSNENTPAEIIAVFHDITTLQELQERQADFVANASHELATPLTAITGFSETLLDGAVESPELARKFVSIIHTEAERMNRLVKELLQLAKLNSQEYRSSLVLEPVALNQLAATVAEEFSPQLTKKAQLLQLDFSPATPKVDVNPDWLKQAIINLVDNAIKYTPNQGKIFLRSWVDAQHAYLSITDSGIGISANELPLIFDRFYRVDRSRVRSEGGTGLGLSLTKFIIELFDGRIEVASTPGSGSTFTIILPLLNAKPTDSNNA